MLPTVDSTNNYAMAQIHAGKALHGTTYLALDQSAGKGQRGKSWISSPRESLLLSVVMQPAELALHQQFLLSATVALACYDFLKNYAPGETLAIKWPNDLYWQDRKAGGILIENIISGTTEMPGSWQWAVAGVGINISQEFFPPALSNAISIRQITGRRYDVISCAQELYQCLVNRYGEMLTTPAANIIAQYNSALYKRGSQVTLKKESAVFQTTIAGVSANGLLLTSDVMQRQFSFGEVEWVVE